jgi:hypothetical protein
MTYRRRTYSHPILLDLIFIVVLFIPVVMIGVGIGSLLIVVGTAGTAVYALTRRGRGPHPLMVFEAVCGAARPLFQAPIRLWTAAHR